MAYPPLVHYTTVMEYRAHFDRVYCKGPISTFDGINSRFRTNNFDHCFFESTKRNDVKDVFSLQRALRIDWIKTALQDDQADLYVGWNRKKRKHDRIRRVAVVCGDYVVIVRVSPKLTGQFITAYVADSPQTIAKIKGSPKWTP